MRHSTTTVYRMICESVSEELVQSYISANTPRASAKARKCFKVELRSDRNEGTNAHPEFGEVRLTTSQRYVVGKVYRVTISS